MDSTYIIREIAITALPILAAVILHEVAHGYAADKLGDPTAKMLGRLTLNPIAHIDIFGTVLMPLLLYISTNGQFVFGYAKPVPINPMNFRNPKRDMALSAAAGPLTNILLAVLCLLLLKYAALPASTLMPGDTAAAVVKPAAMMLRAGITINVILAAFNLIPLPPLDGGRVLMGLLPHKQSAALGRIEPYGMIVILILVITGMAGYIISPIINVIAAVLKLI
ncbi:MAG: site-2 protease family protein [Nitrospirae bacterium]|nr:site-2 protease family protein [Nitrospirota bacterium]